MLSIVCEAFTCLPDEAERQDWRTVKAILDYRTAQAAKQQHNQDATKMTDGMVVVWGEMTKAMIEAKQGQGNAHG